MNEDDLQFYCDMTQDTDPKLRHDAYEALYEFLYKDGISDSPYIPLRDAYLEAMERGLNDEVVEIRRWTLETLTDLDIVCYAGTSYVNYEWAISDTDDLVKVIALRWFYHYQNVRDVKLFRQIIKLAQDDTKSDALSVGAIETLRANIRLELEHPPEMQQAFQDAFRVIHEATASDSRRMVISALGALVNILPTPHPAFKTPLLVSAKERLQIFEGLKFLMYSEDKALQMDAINKLMYVAELDILSDIAQLFPNLERYQKTQLLQSLIWRYEFDEVKHLIVTAYADNHASVRQKALAILIEQLSEAEVQPYLEQALIDDYAFVRYQAQDVLGIPRA